LAGGRRQPEAASPVDRGSVALGRAIGELDRWSTALVPADDDRPQSRVDPPDAVPGRLQELDSLASVQPCPIREAVPPPRIRPAKASPEERGVALSDVLREESDAVVDLATELAALSPSGDALEAAWPSGNETRPHF
jgi:hypothetical protein